MKIKLWIFTLGVVDVTIVIYLYYFFNSRQPAILIRTDLFENDRPIIIALENYTGISLAATIRFHDNKTHHFVNLSRHNAANGRFHSYINGTNQAAVPISNVTAVDCPLIMEGNQAELKRGLLFQRTHPKVNIPDTFYKESTRDCATFRRDRGYISTSLTEEEADFPLAFSIVMYKDLEQVERLLRAIYRPQNFYCIHVDAKAKTTIKDGVRALAKCFDNVILPQTFIDVHWGFFSVLQADLLCMEVLLRLSYPWKYFINLTGQEWPLKTNLGLVRILKAVNGTNLIVGTEKGAHWDRIKYIRRGPQPYPTHDHPPTNITICKGPVHIVATRSYVSFVLRDPRGQHFLNWVKDTEIPDETFFASLNQSPDLGVPGAYRGRPVLNDSVYPSLTRFKVWDGRWHGKPFLCGGRQVRTICVFGLSDLRHMKFDLRKELFLNKVHLDRQSLLLDCLEQYTFERIRLEQSGNFTIDTEYYKKLELARNHNPS